MFNSGSFIWTKNYLNYTYSLADGGQKLKTLNFNLLCGKAPWFSSVKNVAD